MVYRDFFEAATSGFRPMGWQCRLACGGGADPARPHTLTGGVECQSRLIDIPTGCGKTAGLVLAWLWNRIALNDPAWPRRLIYCLPMRTLVEQTRDNVKAWIQNLNTRSVQLGISNESLDALRCLLERPPIVLMGGEEPTPASADWDLYPEHPAIFIGTQDMLLSRALNRGYAMSRYRWPRHFGLLNNDCLWICDEVQLMGPGVATASQLEAFRRDSSGGAKPHGFGSFFGPRSATWYASATTSADLLLTRDWREAARPADFVMTLSDADRAETGSVIGRRRFAAKCLELHRDQHFGDKQPPSERVAEIIERHSAMVKSLANHNAPADVPRRSLVICNTVDRAVAVFETLQARMDASELQNTDLVLLHSRFRPADRREQADRLKPHRLVAYANGQIVVSTQVIEAGVDLSSGILWTEAAPLSSVVQRLGRLNRGGEFGAAGKTDHGWTPTATVLGLELPVVPASPKEKKEAAEREVRARHLPYDPQLCDQAWNALPQLNGDASPASLESIRDAIAGSIRRTPYSLQRHELLDFFDTDSNLSLGYTDVSPFVRGLDEDTDVYVLWRDWKGTDPNEHFDGDIGRDELCPVPISRLTSKDRGFPNWRQGWVWRGKRRRKQGGWVSAATQGVLPGATLLLPTSAGGYDKDRGWTGRDGDKPEDLFQPAERPSDEDALSWLDHGWRSIADHGKDVCDELNTIFCALPKDVFITAAEKQVCLRAALWHDLGKNHKEWKDAALEALSKAGIPIPSGQVPLAKFSLFDSPRLRDENGNLFTGGKLRHEVYRLKREFQPGVAHEVASALALRQRHIETAGRLRSMKTSDEYLAQLLAEYLVMSHHGRVRKVLRDEIPKEASESKDRDAVRGVTQGDSLEDFTADGEVLGCRALSVDCRAMGRDAEGYESYTRGVLRLLDRYGPFRLAYLEALLRAADGRASKMVANA